MMDLKGRVAIITGATRGIGRAAALELAKHGSDIAFTYLKSQDLAKTLEAEIKGLGRQALSFQVDTRDYAGIGKFIGDCKEKFGKIDILVNNAGIAKDKALMLMERADWQDVIDTNLNGLFNITRQAIVTFLKQKSGNIINVTSLSGVIGLSRQTNYSASKAGIIGFTRALAKEAAPFNVRVNAVAPGFIETDMTLGLKDDYRLKLIKDIPLARFGSTDEVAKLIAYLASDASSYITGQVIRIDGGLGMQ